MKTSSRITHFIAKILNSDLKIKRSEQTEYSHGTILPTIGLLSVNESGIKHAVHSDHNFAVSSFSYITLHFVLYFTALGCIVSNNWMTDEF